MGLSTWSLLNLDVYSAVEAIGDGGIGYVEVWGEVPHGYPGWVDRRRLRDVLSTYNFVITTHAPFTDLNPASAFQPVRGAVEEALEEYVELAVYLGATKVTVHPGSVHNHQLVPGSAQNSAATLQKMVRAASGRLSINIENQTESSSKYYYPLASTVETLGCLLRDVPGSECTFDTGHANAGGQDLSGFGDSLGDKMTEIHLSDNMGSADEHLIPGEGSAPLNEFMERFAQKDVLTCLELNPYRYSNEDVLGAVKRMVEGKLGQDHQPEK